MKPVADLSDKEIDALLLHLFHSGASLPVKCCANARERPVHELSDEDLLRIRSKNHPDKWPNVNQNAYQAAVEELDRRRHAKQPPPR